ncbi:sigma-70 family RNA polymerase sigma factor [candidate division KSB1 bacterium]
MQAETDSKSKLFEKEALVHLDALYNMALKLTYNEEDARDLVQETYFKAFRFFDQFQEGSNCKAWLFTILKNTFINSYRKNINSSKKVEFDSVEPFIDLVKDKQLSNDSPDINVLDHYLSDEVDAALLKLPEEYKIVLVLSDIEGFSYKEIADILDCPIGTIRSRLSRARGIMFRLLLKYAKDRGMYKSDSKRAAAMTSAI